MKRWALALLVAAAVTWVVAKRAGWVWVEAFAEAAVVGGLADWFAVTAIFRHPLGLPIPHTAIIMRQKGRIGQSIGAFIRELFLTEEVLREQVREWKPVGVLARWARQTEGSGALAGVLTKAWRSGLSSEQRGQVREVVADEIESALNAVPLRKLLRFGIDELLHAQRHRQLFGPVFAKLAHVIEANGDWIADSASREAPMKELPGIGKFAQALAGAFGDVAVEKLVAQLRAAAAQPSHALHDRVEQTLREMYADLDESRELPESWQRWRIEMLQNGRVRALIARGLELLGSEGRADSERRDEEGFCRAFSELLPSVITRLTDDAELAGQVEELVTAAVVEGVADNGLAIEKVIARTVERIDGNELVGQLERRIGSDLQFVRINGTVIGGAIGLVMHAVGLWI